MIYKETGIKNTISYGISIKSTIDVCKELFYEKGTYTNASAMIAALAINPALDLADLEGVWDADDSELLAGMDKLAKGSKFTLGILGLAELATGGTAGLAVAGGMIIASLVDALIQDKDEVNLIRKNEDGDYEFDFDYKKSDGTQAHYQREIRIAENPEGALNELYGYLEIGKIMLVNHLEDLENNRDRYISNVKNSIEKLITVTGVLNLDDATIEALWDIYSIPGEVIYKGIYDYRFEDNSKENPELKTFYKVTFNYYNFMKNPIVIKQKKISKEDIIPFDIIQPEYTGRYDRYDVYVGYKELDYSDIQSLANNFFKSIFDYAHKNYTTKKNEMIDDLVDELNVYVGQVFIASGENMYFSEFAVDHGDDSIDDQYADYLDEAHKSKASYISKNRIRLAQELSSSFYAEVLALGGWHSSLVTQIQEQDNDIANAIKRSKKGK